MMLRPATPLTVLLLLAFLLLLVSVLSTPIIKQIPLASFGGVDVGVFGLCKGTNCTPIEIGYSTDIAFTPDQTSTFDLPSNTRTTLSAILIVHPIAALFTLIMLVLAASAHFHTPSHSPRYLLAIFILSILTLILALLSFLIDVLLFVPHMAWGSYIVLAATILIAASGIVSCAMRRTLVSRKARKRRIEENAEMNGENFYNRQGGTNPAIPPAMESNTMVNGAPGDKLPAFATFEMAKNGTKERTSDERMPLTTRSPTEPSPGNMTAMSANGYGAPPSSGNGSPPRPPRERDQFGNPMPEPPIGAYGGPPSRDQSLNRQYSDPRDQSLNRQYSDPAMRGRGMSPGGYRGRGGYPSNGRGGYGPPRGGYGGPQRGGYGPPRGGYGPPRGRGGGPPPVYGPPQSGQSPGGYRGPPGNGYGENAYAPPMPGPNPAAGYTAFQPEQGRSSLARAESPPPMPGYEEGPVGQAIEMDATTGSPSHAPRGYGNFATIRESDGDVAGMVALQQQNAQRQTVQSETSRYSTDEYVPPRQVWGAGAAGRSSPLNHSQTPELPTRTAIPQRRESSDNYYEDVDPRFAEPPPAQVPSALAPGYRNESPVRDLRVQPPQNQPLSGMDGSYSYEDIQPGQRSPAESDRSNFTSVSQRGINPRWNPGPMPTRGPNPGQQRREDLLLNSNPDFMLPSARGGRGGARGGGRGGPQGGLGRIPGGIPGMVPNSAYPGGNL
ncbi:SUR7/PalI family-domain-containing protein [Amylocarpus encephaloides]|uniref:SUR7/PalI family-domain-containing protein n=1 Tax=Amylocarpus encephaloides TaxID=45428 RepID=A0A9P7YCM5_9HELO|nr:SUR7/PalI family-domain-containing protein [Amylocarpus encephaloides]